MVGTAGLNASGLLDFLMRHFEAARRGDHRITTGDVDPDPDAPAADALCVLPGLLARDRRTVPILGSKIVELVIVAAVLLWSLDRDPVTGIYAVASAAVVSAATGLAYLWWATRGVRAGRSD